MKQKHQHQGMVLVIGIFFLLILTMIGLTAMNGTALTEKMTQNLRDVSTAFQAGEAALNDGEKWLNAQTGVPSAVNACATPPCRIWVSGTIGEAYQKTNAWWTTNGTVFSGTFAGVPAQPRYIIEQYSFTPYDLSPDALSTGRGYYYYRVSARGTGLTSDTMTNVQSFYCARFN